MPRRRPVICAVLILAAVTWTSRNAPLTFCSTRKESSLVELSCQARSTLVGEAAAELDQASRRDRISRHERRQLRLWGQDLEHPLGDPAMQRAHDRLVLADRVAVRAVAQLVRQRSRGLGQARRREHTFPGTRAAYRSLFGSSQTAKEQS